MLGPADSGRPKLDRIVKRIQKAAQWVVRHPGQHVLPLALAWYVNRRYFSGPAPASELPAGPWVVAEAGRLLERSERRLESVEAKGPGLATVCAIVVAAVVVAISLTWSDAGLLARVFLAASVFYGAMSLYAPIKLVGPIARSTITVDVLGEIGNDEEPVRSLARRSVQAAADNDQATARLANLQAASRNDLGTATLFFAVWLVLGLLGLAT